MQKVILKAVDQLYGAECVLQPASCVERPDGTPRVALPRSTSRRVDRVAVVLGHRKSTQYEITVA